jgi:hypothetical protein
VLGRNDDTVYSTVQGVSGRWFGSAVAMFPTAPLKQEARWASIPQDGRWYILEQPTHLPHDAGYRPDNWPELAGGAIVFGDLSSPSSAVVLRCVWCGIFRVFIHNQYAVRSLVMYKTWNCNDVSHGFIHNLYAVCTEPEFVAPWPAHRQPSRFGLAV